MNIENKLIGIGEKIKYHRKSKKWTQKELGEKLGESAQVVSNWEREYTFPDLNDIQKLAIALEVSTDYLHGLTNDPRIPINTTHEGVDAIRSGDLEKMIQMMEELDEIRYKGKVIKADKREIIMKFFKEIYLPGIIEENESTKNNGNENN